VQRRRDLELHRFRGWLPPDAGSDQAAPLTGGGLADWDCLTAAQAAAFLRDADPRSSRPFALIVSLVNPRDIRACPSCWEEPSYSDIPPYEGAANYADDYPECVHQGIQLPPTWDEVPRRNRKPGCQWQSTEMWSVGLEPVRSPERIREYDDCHACLHKRSDEDMGAVLDALCCAGQGGRSGDAT
jgi:choline-sulfatase